MMEAGYQRAISTCRDHPCAVDHIDDWAKVKERRCENLIALYHQCHNRKGSKPGQIDRKALLGYGANLSTLIALYNDLERRTLETFAERRNDGEAWGEIELDYTLHFMVSRLFGDRSHRDREGANQLGIRGGVPDPLRDHRGGYGTG